MESRNLLFRMMQDAGAQLQEFRLCESDRTICSMRGPSQVSGENFAKTSGVQELVQTYVLTHPHMKQFIEMQVLPRCLVQCMLRPMHNAGMNTTITSSAVSPVPSAPLPAPDLRLDCSQFQIFRGQEARRNPYWWHFSRGPKNPKRQEISGASLSAFGSF